jgi:rhodanese-related sulfurtransferase
MNAPDTITPNSTMAELLAAFPAAQRTLFRKFHIGGCSSCAFDPAETVAALCARNGSLDPAAVLEHVRHSQKEDDRVQMGPAELKRLRDEGVPHRLLDIRTREEFEAVRIEGAIPFTQDAMTEILGRWPREELMIVCDHTGQKCMDAAAYFLGHGFTQVRALRGGIDAWAREIDPGMRRYRIE